MSNPKAKPTTEANPATITVTDLHTGEGATVQGWEGLLGLFFNPHANNRPTPVKVEHRPGGTYITPLTD